MAQITIHTASYNRAYILGKAYESLKAQTCKDFEWIISDDGSSDNTEELVKSWQQENNGFEIIYSKLPHVGFPRALNLDKMAGIGVTRCYPDGSFMKNQVPMIDPKLGYVDASNSDRAKYKLNMDCFEVNRTELLRKYPFQYWPTEEYAPPALNYNAMSLDGWKWRWRIGKLYICEYLQDGLTKSNKKLSEKIQCPISHCLDAAHWLNLGHPQKDSVCKDKIINSL